MDTLAVFRAGSDSILPELASISTTHIPLIRSVKGTDQLVGVGYADYIKDAEIHEKLESGEIRSITSNDQLNFEVVVDVGPDVLLVYPYGNENYDRYKKAGINVLPVSEYAESHPLGRAEWIKAFGVLTGNYEEAKKVFETIKAEYQHWKNEAMLQSFSPSVFTGSFYKGRWSAPGGDSFVAQFIRDAGARYVFAEYPGSENVELDFEVVLEKITHADFFGKVLHRDGDVTREDFMEENERFELLRDFSDEELFFCNTGHSDYFGQGLLEPHLMLRDLYHIFHVEEGDSARFVYFKPLSL